jgi:hypothetical protein
LPDEELARTPKTTPATIADHPTTDSRETPNATIKNPNVATTTIVPKMNSAIRR